MDIQISNDASLNHSIELGLPFNPAYVSSARLTASSIANQMGFDIEEIEEIKNAISAACTYFIEAYHPNEDPVSMFTVQFNIQEKELEILLSSSLADPQANHLPSDVITISGLMDDVNWQQQNRQMQIQMRKKLHF
ncbi:MAG: hypothetical protein GX238_04275 [Epulopiscium sp.]|nr:hypothetical protein [Candidatus Epulonipiscium sp.]